MPTSAAGVPPAPRRRGRSENARVAALPPDRPRRLRDVRRAAPRLRPAGARHASREREPAPDRSRYADRRAHGPAIRRAPPAERPVSPPAQLSAVPGLALAPGLHRLGQDSPAKARRSSSEESLPQVSSPVFDFSRISRLPLRPRAPLRRRRRSRSARRQRARSRDPWRSPCSCLPAGGRPRNGRWRR